MPGSDFNIPIFTPPSPEFYFLASDGHIYEYARLYGFADRLHQEIKEISFSEKKPLLIVAESSDIMVFLTAAAFLLKIPVLIIHPETSGQDIAHILKQVNPPLFFTDQEKNLDELSTMPRLSVRKQWLSLSADWNPELFSLNDEDIPAGLFLTSGSTGRPKIVPVKRRQIYFAAHSSAQNFKPDANRYWLLCLPLNHIGGISIIYRSVLYGSAVFRMDRFDVDTVRTFLSENKLFEAASLVPTMLIRILDDPLFQIHSSFKALLLGGGPISLDLVNYASTRGIPIVTSYGMTETCAQIAANPILNPSGMYIPKTSAGRIFKPNEIEIRSESGKVLPPIEQGQIWLRGPQIFDGYLDSRLNKNVFDTNGWFNTGDFGHVNRYGQLFVKNRREDLIITGGENVNPVTVQNELNRSEGIKESAVFGVPDTKWGQRVIAFIVTVSPDLNIEDLKTNLKKNLRGFQVPKEIFKVDELPKTSMGKVKRGDLLQIYKTFK